VQGVDQGIELAQALRIFTLAGAEALYLEAETGSLAPGKMADFIVLDRQLFDIPPDQISDTQVLLTVFGGKEIYRAP
jgi:predicted amidohydrolase YtcJ